jgi:predicted GIY-YIG superfamily endonuclease
MTTEVKTTHHIQSNALKYFNMAYLYIVMLRDKTCYCGITSDIVRRITDHMKGKSKSTRRKLPLVIKCIKEFESMQSARSMEVLIKKQGPYRWMVKHGYSDNNLSVG